MSYEVIKHLGDRKVGDIVSDEYGQIIEKMYTTPHVKKVVSTSAPAATVAPAPTPAPAAPVAKPATTPAPAAKKK